MTPDDFRADIEAVPERLDALADHLVARDPWAAVRADVPAGSGRRGDVLLAGMGSSWFAASTAASWLRAAGLRAVPELASTTPGWLGGSDTLAVLVSASGGTRETLARRARLAPGTCTVALTEYGAGPLAAACDAAVELRAGAEDGGVACRSFRHTLALLAALGRPLSDVVSACREAALATAALLEDRSWLDEVRSVVAGAQATYWLAPGEVLAVAQQGALMMREVPGLPATAAETGEWYHVDAYLAASTDYRVIMLTGSPWDDQAAEWLTQHGSRVCSLGSSWLGVPGERHLPLSDDPLVRSLVTPLVAELIAFDSTSRQVPMARAAFA